MEDMAGRLITSIRPKSIRSLKLKIERPLKKIVRFGKVNGPYFLVKLLSKGLKMHTSLGPCTFSKHRSLFV